MRPIILSLLAALVPSMTYGWSECGHHIIAVMAYDLLRPDQQEKVLRVLKAHPRFHQDFTAPSGTTDESHWLIGRAGYWPNIARRLQPWNRPNWHFQIGAIEVLGKVENVPAYPLEVPLNANLDTQDLYVAQAIQLCNRIIADEQESDSNKALAICWLCHLVADAHQPCHAGSLYVENVFPEGDHGANSIPVKQGSNLHGLWDGLLGGRYDANDIRRQIAEIKKESLFLVVTGFDPRFDVLDAEVWLKESREAARSYVYTPEVMESISLAMRSDRDFELLPIRLSESYLESAGRVAQLRAIQSSARLSAILGNLR